MLILFPVYFSSAQASYSKDYRSATNDSARIAILLKWGESLIKAQPDSAFLLLEKGLDLSSKSSDRFSRYSEGSFLEKLGLAYKSIDQNDKATAYYLQSLAAHKKAGNNQGTADSYETIASHYSMLGKNVEALEYTSQYLHFAEKINSRTDIAYALNIYGVIYRSQGDFQQSISYMEKALNIHEENKNDEKAVHVLSNLGVLYFTVKEKNKALSCFERSYSIAKEGKLTEAWITAATNLGTFYEKTGNDSLAMKCYLEAQALTGKVNDKRMNAIITNNISDMLQKQGRIEEANSMLVSNLLTAKESGNKEVIMQTADRLVKLYTKHKQFDKAVEMQTLFFAMRDSVNNLQTQRLAAKKQAQYEYDKRSALEKAEYEKQQAIAQIELERQALMLSKNQQSLLLLEQENELKELAISQSQSQLKQKAAEAENQQKAIELLNKDNALKEAHAKQKEEELQKQRIATYGAAGGAILVLALLGVMVNAFRNKQKANLIITRQKREVEQQKEEVENQKHLVEEKNKEILDSITYAKRLQEAILPPVRQVKESLSECFVLYKPKDIVAGDFYWMEKRNDVVLFAAADCTGHGVPGAMVSVVCSNALNRAVKEFGLLEPGEILNKVRELVIETFEKSESDVKDGMDISLCALDMSDGTLKWAGANNPLWLLRSGAESIEEYKADKQPIGKMDQMKPFNTHTIPMQKGDSLYIFSDGYVDQFGGGNGKKFKSANLKKLIIDIRDNHMQQQQQLIDKVFEEWRGNLEQIDDVCVIGVRFN